MKGDTMKTRVGIVRFRNKNGVKFRGVPVDGGYRIQRRSCFIWVDETVEQATSVDLGLGLRRISIERVPVLCSQADFSRSVADGILILDAVKEAGK